MGRAVDVRVSRRMQAPQAAVWGVLSDLHRLDEWLDFAAAVNDQSGVLAEAGATYSVKPPRAYEPVTRWRIVEVVAPTRQVHAAEMPLLAAVTSTIELSGGDDGAVQATVHWHATPRNVLGRLMRALFQRQVTAGWERSLGRLDRLALQAPAQ
jgi:uncharacterized protein YndB with AHSA1/START domain